MIGVEDLPAFNAGPIEDPTESALKRSEVDDEIRPTLARVGRRIAIRTRLGKKAREIFAQLVQGVASRWILSKIFKSEEIEKFLTEGV